MKRFLYGLVLVAVIFSSHPKPILAEPTKVIINEIAWMGSASSSSDEWLELKNISQEEVDLFNWSLEASDGSPKIKLSGRLAVGAFFILERSDDGSLPNIKANQIYTGALDNTGEKLVLKNKEGGIEDEVDMASKWQGGDNTSKKTLERKADLFWQTSQLAGGTPGQENSSLEVVSNNQTEEPSVNATSSIPIVNQETPASGTPVIVQVNNNQENSSSSTPTIQVQDDKKEERYDLGSVLINEIVSDPADGEKEWVELYNYLERELDLSGFYLEEGGGTKTFLKGILPAHGLIVIEDIKGSLNNKGDIISLRDSRGNLLDKLSYGDWEGNSNNQNAPATADPNSLARRYDGYNTYNNANDFLPTSYPTKGVANKIIGEEKEITKKEAEEKVATSTSSLIIINEILPNPVGTDSEGEFVEICNNGQTKIDLSNWSLVGKNKKIILGKVINFLEIGQCWAVTRLSSGLVLDNFSDTLKLYSPTNHLVQKVGYKDGQVGWSYSRDEQNNWAWTEVATPGEINQFKKPNHKPEISLTMPTEKIFSGQAVFFDASDSFDEDGDILSFKWDFGDGIKVDLPGVEHTYLKPGHYRLRLQVDDGRSQVTQDKIINVLTLKEDEGEKNINTAKKIATKTSKNKKDSKTQTKSKTRSVKKTATRKTGSTSKASKTSNNFLSVTGQVVSLPGQLASQYFYLTTADGNWQIYSYKKDFPKLNLGDQIKVSGTVSRLESENRLKIKNSGDIKILKTNGKVVVTESASNELEDEKIGGLVALTGEVSEKKAQYFYLDDGQGEVKVYLKKNTGLSSKALSEGERIKVTGILAKSRGELAVFPRLGSDLVRSGQVLATTEKAGDLTLPVRDTGKELLHYLLAGFMSVTLVLIIIVFRLKKASKALTKT